MVTSEGTCSSSKEARIYSNVFSLSEKNTLKKLYKIEKESFAKIREKSVIPKL